MILFLRALLNVVIMQAQDNTEFKAGSIKFIKKTVKEDAFVIEVHGGTKLKIVKTAVSMTGDASIEQK